MRRGGWCASSSAFLMASGLLLIGACGPETFDTPLASIAGRWTTTDDPRYADRAFEITEDFLYLLQGGDTFAVHKIHDVEITEDDLPRYTIEYRGDAGDLYLFRVSLSQEEGGTLYLANQMNMKWRRDPSASVPWGVLTDLHRRAPPRSGS